MTNALPRTKVDGRLRLSLTVRDRDGRLQSEIALLRRTFAAASAVESSLWSGTANRPPAGSRLDEAALALAAGGYARTSRLAPGASGEPVGVSLVVGAIDGRPAVAAAVQGRNGTRSTLFDDAEAEPISAREFVEWVVAEVIAAAGGESRGTATPRGVLHETAPADPAVTDVRAGRRHVIWWRDGAAADAPPEAAPAGFLSGSFNPLHEGHRALRAAAERRLGGPVAFELPITNADKPPLDDLTLARRCRQFAGEPLALTDAPTFVEKAALFPGGTFVLGVDTAERVLQPRFYRDRSLRQALKMIRARKCRFLVAGRCLGSRFTTIGDTEIPAEFRDLFEELPEVEFRADVSSTERRRRRGGS